MTFSEMVDDLFDDPILAMDAIYTPAGGETWDDPVRVMKSQPDVDVSPFGGSVVSATTVLEVRVSEIAEPGKGDTFAIGDDVYTVTGKPQRDEERLVWKLEAGD